MIKTIIKIILLTLLVVSCNGETKFFDLKSEETTQNNIINKHIVIANPPQENDSLHSKVLKYCKTELSICEALRDNYDISIFFYKETWSTPRDFKSNDNDCNFGSKYIGCQTDDIICVLKSNKKNNTWNFELRKNIKSKWVTYPFKLNCYNNN